MIRFVMKSALALGLVAMVVPLGNASRTDESTIDLLGVVNGVQEAAVDLGGFCGRAPAACDAGREVATFAGERIEAGFRIGYSYLNERFAAAPSPSAAVATVDIRPDPLTTGAVGISDGPRPYIPPRPVTAETVADVSGVSSVPPAVAVPTPAPRG